MISSIGSLHGRGRFGIWWGKSSLNQSLQFSQLSKVTQPTDQPTNQLELFYPQSYLDNSVYHSGLVLFKLSLLCSCFWPVLDQLDFTIPHWTPQRQLNYLFIKDCPFLNRDRETAKYRKTVKKGQNKDRLKSLRTT